MDYDQHFWLRYNLRNSSDTLVQAETFLFKLISRDFVSTETWNVWEAGIFFADNDANKVENCRGGHDAKYFVITLHIFGRQSSAFDHSDETPKRRWEHWCDLR